LGVESGAASGRELFQGKSEFFDLEAANRVFKPKNGALPSFTV